MDKKTLNILVCPKCQSALEYDKNAEELICQNDQLAFPVRDGIPVMLVEEARSLANNKAEQ
ncbi:MAG: Trm112 family protein [Gammaproteobacteria bacterium]|nr:Trm112 family protein [Gammaproteobacteria bacterium]